MDADGRESFASEPRSNRVDMTVQFPHEKTIMTSAEAQYRPVAPVQGFTGAGYAETDHKLSAPAITVDIPAGGEYAVDFRYANGNGPVNTENRCAIRTLFVDGVNSGTVVMPQRGRGNWDDWGWTNTLRVDLPAGRHTIELRFLPENENMNLHTNHALVDELRLRRLRP